MQALNSNHHKSILLVAFLIMTSLAITQPALAETHAAKVLLEQLADKMFKAINDNRLKIKAEQNVTDGLIEDILLPNIDFITASKYVLGKHWDTASKAQKIGFIKAFRSLLLRFYSSALTEYLNTHDEKLDNSLMVFQDPGPANNGQITVRSTVSPKTGKPVPIHYQLHMTRKGWKVYDVSVEGVSVITTYKTSFASEITQSGLDALIVSLNERNKKLLAGETSMLKTTNKQ